MNPHALTIFYDPIIGSDAVYQSHAAGSVEQDVRVILTRNAEVWTGEVVEVQDAISLLTSQVAAPEPRDTVSIGSTTWVLVNRLLDDGVETRWSARRRTL